MNVVIPVAGSGSRFAAAGYSQLKPLIDVAGKPMLAHALEPIPRDWRVYVVCRDEHLEPLAWELPRIREGVKLLTVAGATQGAACTVLAAAVGLPADEPICTMNCDQRVELYEPLDVTHARMEREGADGWMLTFPSQGTKWSYADVDADGFITEVAEKRVIGGGRHATVGLYVWRKASELVWSIADMVSKNHRTNGEFYTAPCFNEGIRIGMRFKAVPVKAMHGLGTPEDVARFEGRA